MLMNSKSTIGFLFHHIIRLVSRRIPYGRVTIRLERLSSGILTDSGGDVSDLSRSVSTWIGAKTDSDSIRGGQMRKVSETPGRVRSNVDPHGYQTAMNYPTMVICLVFLFIAEGMKLLECYLW